jgi:hypothetical protein
VFDRQGEPRDDKTAILSQVVEGLLSDHRILAQVLFIYRGWPGLADPATRDVWVQRFRGRTPEEDQFESVEQLGILTHETTHSEHPDYTSHHFTIPAGTNPYSTMSEGLPSWLTTLGWENIWPRLLSDIEFRRVVEGPHADTLPPLPETWLKFLAHRGRYPSDAPVIHVASLAGSWENWLAAVLTGDARKVTGPLTTHVPVQAGQPQHPAAPQQPTSTPPAPETPRN